MRKPPDHRVPRNPFAAAATAPLVELDDAASDHRAVGLEPLPNGFETELIQSAERGQVRASEGSVVHVEVFRMGSVRTSILGRPRLRSRHRRAVSFYTLICEEPDKCYAKKGYFNCSCDRTLIATIKRDYNRMHTTEKIAATAVKAYFSAQIRVNC